MKKTKTIKMLGFMLVLVMMASVFSACGTDKKIETTPSASASASETTKPITVKWVGAGWNQNNKATVLAERFKVTHPNVTVEYTDIAAALNDEFFQKYDTMIASGEQIDLVYMDLVNIVKRSVNGAMKPIDDYIKAAGDNFEKDFGTAYNVLKMDNKYYGIPYSAVTYKIYINKDLLATKGIKVTNDWTIEDYKSIAAKFTDAKAGLYGSFIDYTWAVVETMYAQAELAGWSIVKKSGDKVLANFDDPRFKSNLQFLYDLSMKDKVNPDYATIKAEKLNRRLLFVQGKIPMYLDSWNGPIWTNNYAFDTEGGKGITFDWETVNLPRLDTTVPADIGYLKPIGIFGIPKTAKEGQSAYEFAKFVGVKNPEYLMGIPASTSVKIADVLKTYTTYTDKKGVKHENIYSDKIISDMLTIEKGHYAYYKFDTSLYSKYGNALENLFAQQYSLYFTGQKTLDVFIADLQKEGQKLIDAVK